MGAAPSSVSTNPLLRARFVLIILLACFLVACLAVAAIHPKPAATLKSLVLASDDAKLWPSPTSEDYRVLRAIPAERPSQFAKLRIVVSFGWYGGLTNMEYSALSAFILAKSIGAEVRRGSVDGGTARRPRVRRGVREKQGGVDGVPRGSAVGAKRAALEARPSAGGCQQRVALILRHANRSRFTVYNPRFRC